MLANKILIVRGYGGILANKAEQLAKLILRNGPELFD
jgi:hypothetical protein